MVEYKVFYKFKRFDAWRTHRFEANSDMLAMGKAGEYINTVATRNPKEEVERWGLEKITTVRLV
jgi:hypothetical protein